MDVEEFTQAAIRLSTVSGVSFGTALRAMQETAGLFAAANERDAALARIAAVSERHQPEACDCNHCDGQALRCPQCIGHWPCDTHLLLAATPEREA